jgi:hypothetical protein
MNNQAKKNQAGISLMLSILVLAAVTAIAFSLATIVFIEIRSAGDMTRTEPTLYGAFGVTEEALFQYKRFVNSTVLNVPTCSPGSGDQNGVCTIGTVNGGVKLTSSEPIEFDDSPRVEVVPAGTVKVIPMYTTTEFTKPQYSSISLQVLPGGPSLDYYFKVTEGEGTHNEGVGLMASTNPSTPFTGFGNGQYALVLQNTSGDDASVVITTVRTGSGPQGLPFVGEQVLRIKADYSGLNRTYQVRIPIP